MSQYTRDTVENTNIVLTPYTRKSITETNMELAAVDETNVLLLSPAGGATGVSNQPSFSWEPFSPSSIRRYLLEYVGIASQGTAPDWSQATGVITSDPNYTIPAEDQLDIGWYAWRVTPASVFDVDEYNETFDVDSASGWGVDWQSDVLAGVGQTSVNGGIGFIQTDPNDPSSVVTTLLKDKNFKNPDILIDGLKFSDVSSDFQPTIHFLTQGTWMDNEHIRGLYIYFFQNEVYLGVITDGPSSKEVFIFDRTTTDKYRLRIKVDGNRIRVAIWDASLGSHPTDAEDNEIWQIDALDDTYESGSIAFKSASISEGSTTLEVDSIEVSFVEGPVTDVTGVTVTGSTDDLEEGQTRQFQATVEGTGNIIQDVDWEVNIGSIDENGLYTADGGTGTIIPKAISTQDPTVDGTIQFEVIAESAPVTGSEAGDIEALEAIAADVSGLPNGWASSGMTLNPAPDGVTVATIEGELRVERIRLFDEGLTGSNGLPSLINNLTEMEYFNVMHNQISGPLPPFNLPKCVFLYLNHSFDVQNPEDELHDKATGAAGGEVDVHGGKNDTGAKNKFTGELYVDCPLLEWIACSWTHITSVDVPQLFSNSTIRGLWIGNNHNLAGKRYNIPNAINNMSNLSHIDIDCDSSSVDDAWGGELPSGMSNLFNLTSFRISRNDFTGAFPDLSNTNIRTFVIDFNRFSSGFPVYGLDGTLPDIVGFLCAWMGGNFVDADLPENLNSGLKTINVTQNNLQGEISDLPNGLIVTDFGENPGITSHDVDMTNLYQIRNLRWQNCGISQDIPKLDWYNFYRQRTQPQGHPLDSFSRFMISGNKYTTAQFNWTVPKLPWEIEAKAAIWYYENKNNLIDNVDPNFSINDYLNAGFSQSTIDSWTSGGDDGFDFMSNILDDIYPGWVNYSVGGQNPD